MALTRARERLLRRIGTRKGREAEAVVLLEGPRAIRAAIGHGAELLFVLTGESPRAAESDSPVARVLERLEASGVEVVPLPEVTLRELSGTESPQGIVGLAREPGNSLPAPATDGARVLVLDALQDPGNAGTLLRAAAALGVSRVLALDGTVDLWNPKVVRASAGYAFALQIHRTAWKDAEPWLRARPGALVVADAEGADLRDWTGASDDPAAGASPISGGWALLVGNEGAGPRPEALAAADVRLAIPMSGGVDSLNAAIAGSLLMWALGPGRDGRSGSAPHAGRGVNP